MSSVTSHTAHSERPERSRNAKAQARHRAKRKAYIEQLEQTVTKLQTALGFSPEDVAALPPPLLKIRELEQDVARLEKENEDLRRMLSDSGTRSLPMDIPRRNSMSIFQDSRTYDRDYNLKRRRVVGNVEGAYMSPSDTPPQGDSLRPPPLTIPHPVSHHYSYMSSSNSSHGGPGHSPMFNLHAPAFQMPNTPSGSSSASSPPFSPAQMQEPLHSPSDHRPSMPVMSDYGRNYAPQPVKVEDDHYASSNHHHSHNGNYPMSTADSYAPAATGNAMSSWNGYSTDRAHMHR
ncbi:hypothetical protein Hypma_001855 [Hypsizygus marmoreus]|uniref:BZIP domain-containing protein n=1 Tax=Hypsizygus marmoreus TaxID=39966 RepID=A0A369J5P7_HYPMA|nr:hypothetical protein Hypma_001855 [Hypsizygus marmoreus]